MKVVIIDDEKHARENLIFLLNSFVPEVQIVGEAANVADSIICINATLPHIVLLDVQMVDGTGFDVINRFKDRDFEVIFITAHDDYALRAIKEQALDYLVKPISTEELEKAIGLAKSRMVGFKLNNSSSNTILLPSASSTRLVDVSKIACLLAERAYTNVYLDDEKMLISKNLKSFQRALSRDERFIRVHRSAIVNTQFVSEIVKTEGGALKLSNGMMINLPSKGKDYVVKQIMQYGAISL